MANPSRRLAENVAGDFYVDDSCIDCDACVPECPVEAIFAEDKVPEQWTDYTAINAEKSLSGLPIISEKLEPLC